MLPPPPTSSAVKCFLSVNTCVCGRHLSAFCSWVSGHVRYFYFPWSLMCDKIHQTISRMWEADGGEAVQNSPAVKPKLHWSVFQASWIQPTTLTHIIITSIITFSLRCPPPPTRLAPTNVCKIKNILFYSIAVTKQRRCIDDWPNIFPAMGAICPAHLIIVALDENTWPLIITFLPSLLLLSLWHVQTVRRITSAISAASLTKRHVN